MFTKSQYVKCLLNNNMMVEGQVEEWSDERVILKSLRDETFIFIMHPKEDIRVVKVQPNLKTHSKPSLSKEKIEGEINNVLDHDCNPFDAKRNKKLADLRIEMSKVDKEIVAEKLRDHTFSNIQRTNYGFPGFLKKQNPK